MDLVADSRSSYYRNTFKIAWPCIVETLLFSIVSIIDGIMVGNLGAVATAAVGVNQPVTWLINSIQSGISVGATVLVAMHCGAEEPDKAKNVARQAVFSAILLGAVISFVVFNLSNYIPLLIGVKPEVAPDAIMYLKTLSRAIPLQFTAFVCSGILRGSGNTKLPMLNAIFMNILNVCGNFFLIYPSRHASILGKQIFIPGAGMGVKGAAIATTFALCVSGIIVLTALFNKNLRVHIWLDRSFRFQKQTLQNILKIGLPSAGEKVTINLGMVLFQSLIANLGTIAISAHYLSGIIESMSYMPAEGFAMAATTLVGQSIGAKRKDAAVIYSKVTMLCAAIVGGVCGFFFLVFPEVVLGFFTNDPAVIANGCGALRIVAIAEPLLCANIVMTGILRGSGDTKAAFYIATIGMWGVRQLTAWFFAYKMGLGLTGAWIGMSLDILTRFILLQIRFRRRRWLNVKVSTE